MKRQKVRKKVETSIKKYKPNKNEQHLVSSFFNIYVQPYAIWILIGCTAIIGFIAFGKFLTTENLFFFKDIGSDSLNQDYPGIMHKIFLSEDGLFNNYTFFRGMGDAFSNTPPSEPYGLFRIILNNIGISIWNEDYLINSRFPIIFIFYILTTGIIFYSYLLTLNVKKFSAITGTLFLSFSGYLIIGSSWGFYGHVFRAVFLLFAFEQLFVKKRWYFFPFAVIYSSGNLFILYIYSLFILLYAVFRFTTVREGRLIYFLKLAGKMIILSIAGLLMNISRIFNGFLKMVFSPRVSGNASYSQALSAGQDIVNQSSIVPTTILRFFSSDILGTGSNFQGWNNYLEAPLFYIGLLTLLIFPQVFIYLDKRKKIIFGSFLGFWVLTLVFPFLRHAMLAFTGDYWRYGFDFFIPFTLLFYAVYALNELDKTFKINYKLLGGTLIVLLVALFFPYKAIPLKAVDNSLRMIIVFILFLYSALLIAMSKPKYKSFAQIGLILLVTVELSYFSYKSYADREPVTKKEFAENAGGYKDGTIKAVDYIKSIDKTLFYRTEKDYQSGNAMHGSLNDAMAQGYYGTTSYSSFNQLNYVRFLEETGLIQKGDETATRWVTGFRGNPLLQTFGNIKYHLSKSEQPDMLRFGFDSLSMQAGVTILKNRFYLPFGYTYDQYIGFDDYKKLTYYQLTQQSLNNIFTETQRLSGEQAANNLIKRINLLLGKTFANESEIDAALAQILGKQESDKIKLLIRKHSVNNFENQLAILNAFVYEKESSDNLSLSDFEKISGKDSLLIVKPEKFNFEIYKSITDSLKVDTLQITEFSQANIKGKIELSKIKMLFFTIPFDKGWKIKVNGENKELSRVNIGFIGIVLPKGNHELELYYVPQYSQITSAISIVSIILFWLFLGYDVYRKRKLKNNNEES